MRQASWLTVPKMSNVSQRCRRDKQGPAELGCPHSKSIQNLHIIQYLHLFQKPHGLPSKSPETTSLQESRSAGSSTARSRKKRSVPARSCGAHIGPTEELRQHPSLGGRGSSEASKTIYYRRGWGFTPLGSIGGNLKNCQ